MYKKIAEIDFEDESCNLDDTVADLKVNKVINAYQIKNPLLLNKGMPAKWESFHDLEIKKLIELEINPVQRGAIFKV